MNRRRDSLLRLAATSLAASLLCAPVGYGDGSGAHADSASPDSRNDMIAALHAPGPGASLGAEAAVWDRFVGTWDCDFSFHLEDGQVKHARGELEFGWVLDGLAIQDLWIVYPGAAETERSIGTSIRFFDGRERAWRVIFVSPKHRALLSVQGGVEGDRIVLRGRDGEGSMLRWSFNDIQPDSFTWRGETSRDGGTTWRLEEEHHMRRRGDPTNAAADHGADMIQSLGSTGPHASLGTEARLFDRFVGTWDLHCDLFPVDGKPSTFDGQWLFGWALDGRLVQDVLIEGSRRRGTTVRFYDEKSHDWRVVWIPPRSGNVVSLRGGAEGDRIVLLGKDVDGSSLRWSFNDIRPDSFLWRGETSSDGGRTWRTEQVMRLKRRTITQAGS